MKSLIRIISPEIYDNKCKIYDYKQFNIMDSYYFALVDISGVLNIVKIICDDNDNTSFKNIYKKKISKQPLKTIDVKIEENDECKEKICNIAVGSESGKIEILKIDLSKKQKEKDMDSVLFAKKIDGQVTKLLFNNESNLDLVVASSNGIVYLINGDNDLNSFKVNKDIKEKYGQDSFNDLCIGKSRMDSINYFAANINGMVHCYDSKLKLIDISNSINDNILNIVEVNNQIYCTTEEKGIIIYNSNDLSKSISRIKEKKTITSILNVSELTDVIIPNMNIEYLENCIIYGTEDGFLTIFDESTNKIKDIIKDDDNLKIDQSIKSFSEIFGIQIICPEKEDFSLFLTCISNMNLIKFYNIRDLARLDKNEDESFEEEKYKSKNEKNTLKISDDELSIDSDDISINSNISEGSNNIKICSNKIPKEKSSKTNCNINKVKGFKNEKKVNIINNKKSIKKKDSIDLNIEDSLSKSDSSKLSDSESENSSEIKTNKKSKIRNINRKSLLTKQKKMNFFNNI